VVEIDPANSRWWELKVKIPQLSRLTRLTRVPLGSGNTQTVQHPLGVMAQLKANNNSADVNWEAYSLAVNQPGRPHVLEVDYPSDVPQTLGLSILEPNAAGALTPISLDSGVDVEEELIAGSTPHWAKHRMVFWPRTNSPLLLVTNGRDSQAAQYGKIRVLGGWDHLPKAFPAGLPSQRLLAAYLDRPLFAENFSASQVLDPWSGRSLDDWTTFHEGGLRLVEYLQYVGYNGLMISVVADGSAIYPSELLQPTPRYDSGVFFGTAQDPLRKDVLEMLFRLFDREDLRLIPSIEFAAPLPELEALRRRGGSEADGIELIGPDGTTWRQNYAARRGLAPYYNTLDPRVQEAMLRVVRELAGRYAQHRSFAGLALRLSAYGFAQLPGPEWGMDDATIARFEQDARLKTPGEGPSRFAARAAFLNNDEHRPLWLQWRADQLRKFQQRARETLVAAGSGARLYLAGAELLSGSEIEADLRPALPPKSTLADALLRAGIDLRQYQDDQGLVLLRPERIVPRTQLSAQAVYLEIGQMPEADQYFRELPSSGSLFFHQPQDVHIPSFDQKSPFKSTFTQLHSQPAPSEARNRQRFIHSLATMDSQLLIDGGWLLSMGQEESLHDLVAVYRRLPAVKFATSGDGHGAAASLPVTFRYAACRDGACLYAVNDSPFAVTAQVQVTAAAGCQLQEFPGVRRGGSLRQDADGAHWLVELGPYDIAAAMLSDREAKLFSPQVSVPGGVESALARNIRQLGVRAAALRKPQPLKVLENPDFEKPGAPTSPIPGWAISKRLGVAVQLDKSQKHGGNQAVHISSSGPVACLVSNSFKPPATGRLSMSVWIRIADTAQQPPLRLAVEGKLADRDYYKFAAIGLAQGNAAAAVPIGSEWGQYIFQVDDLPLEGLSELHVRFDLMGQGDVWIDDVQLFDLAFNEMELRALYKLITLADVTLQNGQIGDCLKLLDGYWPRFLTQHVPLGPDAAPEGTIAATPEGSPQSADKTSAPPQTGLMDRMRNLLPEKLRF
jgi:hypothetical protein